MLRYFIVLVVTSTLFSCERPVKSIGVVDAYKPIYANNADYKLISQKAAQPIVNGGKIAKAGQYLYQVEENKGIHILDLSNPAVPVNKSFLDIPLCNEVTLKGNFLYTNNATDLVVLDLSDINSVNVTSRTTNAFPTPEAYFPPQTGVYFECADAAKGIVIGWELTRIDNPKCRR